MEIIDLRSDTVTIPTSKMHEVLSKLEYSVNPDSKNSIEKLEALGAELMGKDNSLIVPSGCFGNLLGVFTHCQRGDEVLLGEDCHIYVYEQASGPALSAIQAIPIKSNNGEIDLPDLKSKIRNSPKSNDITNYYPITRLICVENAHSNGRAIPIHVLKEIYELAKENGISVHMDGARIFNAAVALNVDPREITKYTDSISFCLSKGLCSPIGSLLAGSKEFIEKARRNRKILGGEMKQVGIMSALGQLSLNEQVTEIAEDHKMAKLLGTQLQQFPALKISLEDIHINMVYLRFTGEFDGEGYQKFMESRKIKVRQPRGGVLRFVVHYYIREEQVNHIVNSTKDYFESIKK